VQQQIAAELTKLTTTKLNKLQEIFISYGNECNDKLLLNYGFSLPGPTGPCEWGRDVTSMGGRDERAETRGQKRREQEQEANLQKR
jgi:hypothetical protein